jgi:hypothetical protein
MSKLHTVENVTYGSRGRRWEFTAEKDGATVYKYGTPTMPGGRETADKVARVINGAVKRSGRMDNLARSNMATIFHKAAKSQSRVVSPIGTYFSE